VQNRLTIKGHSKNSICEAGDEFFRLPSAALSG